MAIGPGDPRYEALQRAAARDAAARAARTLPAGMRATLAQPWLQALLTTLALSAASLGLFVDLYGHEPRAVAPADAVVVLGAGVRPDGTPSDALRHRVAHAVRLWKEGFAPLLAMTGGADAGEPSAADVAKNLAVSLGVDPTAIVTETLSTSTWENAREIAPLLKERGVQRLLVVSDPFHVWRGKKNLEAQGFVASASAAQGREAQFGALAYLMRPLWAAREVISVSRDVVLLRYF